VTKFSLCEPHSPSPFSPPFPTLVFGHASANACARPSGIDSPSPSQSVIQPFSQSVSQSVIQSNGQTVVTGTLQWHRVRRRWRHGSRAAGAGTDSVFGMWPRMALHFVWLVWLVLLAKAKKIGGWEKIYILYGPKPTHKKSGGAPGW